MFYVRGLEKTGYEKRGGGNQKLLYDMSRLSKGVKCALQGCMKNIWFSKSQLDLT